MKNFIFPVIAAIVVTCLGITELTADFPQKEKVYFIEERILLKDLPKDISNLRIWIPYPVSDAWQVVSDLRLISLFDASFVVDEEYGNRIIYLKPKQNISDKSTFEIILSFRVKRKEYTSSASSSVSYKMPSSFLNPNRLVPVNGEIKTLAKKITRVKSNDLERVRAIYDYIIDNLTYSKDDPKVCGIGDSLLTLQHLKGICTDYHSLFISLVRSLEIPAKFEIGFPIPAVKEEGKINGYHCWAKFYIEGKGWIPVDISEADKHPEKHEYFFGHIDENRVHFTTGRDISLEYAQSSQPLNFFIYPYAELDGRQFNNIDIKIYYKDLEGGVE